jgi:transposase
MGLALVVDQVTQLPLAHVLYEGARSDMKTFAEFLKPVRKRLRELTGQPEQLTLVFDAGASSRQNLEGLERYVTAVRPSHHLALLSEAAGHLAEVQLSNGAAVPAWRTQRTVAGKQRDVVVVFSPQLYEGQLRGLRQTLSRSWRELEEMQLHPPVSVEATKRKLDKIRRHQYLRSLLCYEINRDGQGPIRIRLWSDWQEYQRLIARYFGLRILLTDRAEWSTAQIIEAYRGQSKVEAAFRDLKDPRMLSTRPQFHWTDQKLHVHAFLCVTAYLLVTLLHLRAKQKTAFDGGPRRLLAELAEVRCSRLIDMTGHKGRPRVRWQIEEIDTDRRSLVEALHALPAIG